VWVEVAVLFNIHPWQLMFMEQSKRVWYEMAAIRHRNREHEIRQQFLNAIASIFGSGEGES